MLDIDLAELVRWLVIPALGYIAIELVRLRIKVASICTDLKETKKNRTKSCADRGDWINKIEATADRADRNAAVLAAEVGCHSKIERKQ